MRTRLSLQFITRFISSCQSQPKESPSSGQPPTSLPTADHIPTLPEPASLDFIDSGEDLDNTLSFSLPAGEVGLDGDLDLISAQVAGGFNLRLQDSDGSFHSSGSLFGDGSAISICMGWFDRDLDLDLVIGMDDNQGGNQLFFNDLKNGD